MKNLPRFKPMILLQVLLNVSILNIKGLRRKAAPLELTTSQSSTVCSNLPSWVGSLEESICMMPRLSVKHYQPKLLKP